MIKKYAWVILTKKYLNFNLSTVLTYLLPTELDVYGHPMARFTKPTVEFCFQIRHFEYMLCSNANRSLLFLRPKADEHSSLQLVQD